MTLNELPDDGPLLIYGIGNVGRQDDGVGPMLVERLAAAGAIAGVTLETGYQLVPEDALLLAAHTCVLFVDATTAPASTSPSAPPSALAAASDAAALYSCEPVVSEPEFSFTSHAMSPGALLTLCRRLYGRAPMAFALAIPGYGFEINAALSPQAAANLDAAFADLCSAISARQHA